MDKNIDIKQKQILTEGFESVSSDGLGAFTVESLASKLFISKKTIYKYFPTKENLLEQIVRFRMRGIKRDIEQIINSNSNPVMQFIEMKRYILIFQM